MHHLEPYLTYLKKQYSDIDSRVLSEIQTAIDGSKVDRKIEADPEGDYPDVRFGIPDIRGKGEFVGGSFLARGADTCVFKPFIQNIDKKFETNTPELFVSRITEKKKADAEINAQTVISKVLDELPYVSDFEKTYINIAVGVGVPEKIPEQQMDDCRFGYSDFTTQEDLINFITPLQQGDLLSEVLETISDVHEDDREKNPIYRRLLYDLKTLMLLYAEINGQKFVNGDLHSDNVQVLGKTLTDSHLVTFDFGRSIFSYQSMRERFKNMLSEKDKYTARTQHRFPAFFANDEIPGNIGFMSREHVREKTRIDALSMSYDVLSLFGLIANNYMTLLFKLPQLKEFLDELVTSYKGYYSDLDSDTFTANLYSTIEELFMPFEPIMLPPPNAPKIKELSKKSTISSFSTELEFPSVSGISSMSAEKITFPTISSISSFDSVHSGLTARKPNSS